MLIQQEFTVRARLPAVWAFFRDVPTVASCVPGVERMEAVDEKTFQGTMRVKIGPLGFRLNGRLVEQDVDESGHTAVLVVSADDRSLASAVNATLRLRLTESDEATTVALDTEANVLGKLGQFGQGVIKLAADALMKQFVTRVQARLAASASARL
jgi:carbon monoxide dehydrogenase subunit G